MPPGEIAVKVTGNPAGEFIARTEQELSDRLCTALRACMNQPDKTASICSIRK